MVISTFTSCDKPVENVNLPETTPKLVVYSYISPVDTIIYVSVSMSAPIFNNSGNTPKDVTDANVVISDEEGHSTQLLYDEMINNYTVSASVFPIMAGKTYYLKVQTPDGKIAEANCAVPFSNNTSMQFLSLDSIIDQYQNKEYILRVNFTDIPNQQNYYRIYPVVKLHNFDNQGIRYDIYQKMYFKYGDECIDDKDKDGQTFNLSLDYFTNVDPQYSNGDVIDYFKIYLMHADKEYYEFHKSISNYEGSNPFSEPTLIYSNMNGGYGVFAAYNPYELIITYK